MTDKRRDFPIGWPAKHLPTGRVYNVFAGRLWHNGQVTYKAAPNDTLDQQIRVFWDDDQDWVPVELQS